MSIIVVVRKNGRAVIAADSAQSDDDLVLRSEYVRNFTKLLKSGDTWLGLAGWSAAQDIVESALARDDLELDFSSRRAIFESSRKLHELMKNEYFIDTQEEKEQPVESSQVSALLANRNGIFELESYRSVAEYERYWALGSGKKLALGAMHALYKTEADAETIALAGLRAACAFDDGCALPAETRVIELGEDG